jgi:hypothetical protein
MPSPKRDAGRFAPIFVLAPPRSYSSVVTTMIGRHPELADLPELKLFGYRTLGELEATLPLYWRERGFTHRSPGLVRAVAQFLFGGQDVDAIEGARKWLAQRGGWGVAHVLDALLEQLTPRRGVEKSPENVATDAALQRLVRAYPNARYIHLTRHPVSTQASMVEHRNRLLPAHPLEGQPMAGVAAWLDVHRRIERFLARIPSERSIRIRAEDVLNDTDAQLAAIARWLGLRADGPAIAAMRRPQDSPFACFGPRQSGVVGGHDPTFLAAPAPRRARLPHAMEQPVGWSGEKRLWRETVVFAARFGYSDGALRAELLRRRDLDQSQRESFAGAPGDKSRLVALDENNTAWLRGVVDKIGWPGRSLVGEDGSHAAWLLAQHSDRFPAFQQRCLKLLERAAACSEASLADVARLTDRVLLAHGEDQIYGTQTSARDGEYVAYRLRDPQEVEVRREAVGLPPLRQHFADLRARFGRPRPTPFTCPGCDANLDIWPPGPGDATRIECLQCGLAGSLQTKLGTVGTRAHERGQSAELSHSPKSRRRLKHLLRGKRR